MTFEQPISEIFPPLFESFLRRLQGVPTAFHRFLCSRINWEDRLIGIKGPRGCGKTTLLLQHIRETFPQLQRVLYLSLDNLLLLNHSLYDLVSYFHAQGGTHLFLDEIHHYKGWQTLLKTIYDDFPALHIVYTGSSMLQIDRSQGDLSRRQMLYNLPGFSFREYLALEGIAEFPIVSWEELLQNHLALSLEITSRTKILPHFNDYCKHGYYPFYREVHNGFDFRLQQIIQQILGSDYPSIEEISAPTIQKMRRMLMVLSQSVPQTPKMSELFAMLETDRNQGLKMLYALERGGLLSLLEDVTKNLKHLGTPQKIYLDNTNLMYALTPTVNSGTLRETFFCNQTKQLFKLNCPAQGDFLLDGKYLFEVGGPNKTFRQIKDLPESYLAIDDIENGHGNRIPLWLFGMLY